MAETKLADIIIPEVFAPYMMERSLNANKFFQGGILVADANLSAFLGGGGKTSNFPYWQDLTGTSDVPSETVATTVNAIGTDKMIAIRQIREKAWGANDLSAQLAGSDPYTAIGDRVSGFWAKAHEDAAIFTCRGILADNAQNDSSDLIVDISTETGLSATSANKISATKTIEAIMRQGDRFSEMTAICLHSVVYQTLVQNDLIDFVKDSTTNMSIPYYIGLRVIVNDNMPAIAGSVNGYKYHTYLFKSGALAFGENAGKLMPVETFRDPSKGGGIDILYTRRQYAIHPLGFSWVKADNSAISPADAALYADTSWDRVYDKKNTGLVAIVSNG